MKLVEIYQICISQLIIQTIALRYSKSINYEKAQFLCRPFCITGVCY